MIPYNAAAILDLKQGWTGIKTAKIANDHQCAPMIVVKIYLISGFHVKSRNESAHYLLNKHKYLIYACPASFQIQNGGCVIKVCTTYYTI